MKKINRRTRKTNTKKNYQESEIPIQTDDIKNTPENDQEKQERIKFWEELYEYFKK